MSWLQSKRCWKNQAISPTVWGGGGGIAVHVSIIVCGIYMFILSNIVLISSVLVHMYINV